MTHTYTYTTKKYFFDTEFIDDGYTIDLISIGMVCEDGREYYAEFDSWRQGNESRWVRDNVIAHLLGGEYVKGPAQIAIDILGFVFEGQSRPEFWAYYADYDWVALCQLFGTMMQLPNQPPPVGRWPMFCMDIKQLAVSMGDPKLPPQESQQHHALEDARWNISTYRWLMGDQRRGTE